MHVDLFFLLVAISKVKGHKNKKTISVYSFILVDKLRTCKKRGDGLRKNGGNRSLEIKN